MRIRIIATTIVIAALSGSQVSTNAWAQGKGNGKGGGGDGGGGNAAWTIIPFSPPGVNSTGSYVDDVNEQRQAIGSAFYSDAEHDYWHVDFSSQPPVYTRFDGVPGPGGTEALGLNNLNQIVGRIGYGTAGAFWSSPTASMVELPPLPGGIRSGGLAINDDGIVIGYSGEESPQSAVAWRVVVDAAGAVQIDGPVQLPGISPMDTTAVHDVGEIMFGQASVVGSSGADAVVWTIPLNGDGTLGLPSAPQPLGTLNVYDPSWSDGFGINSFGDACGDSDNVPFVVPFGGTIQALPVPLKTFHAQANDINDQGDVVGYAEVQYHGYTRPPGIYKAILWKNDELVDLTSQLSSQSGWERLEWALKISNDGVIGGVGRHVDSDWRGFLMIPNP